MWYIIVFFILSYLYFFVRCSTQYVEIKDLEKSNSILRSELMEIKKEEYMKELDDLCSIFNGEIIKLPLECVIDCSHDKACDDEVQYWQKKLSLKLERSFMIEGLSKYSFSWSKEYLEELTNDKLEQKVIQIVSGDIKEELCS